MTNYRFDESAIQISAWSPLAQSTLPPEDIGFDLIMSREQNGLERRTYHINFPPELRAVCHPIITLTFNCEVDFFRLDGMNIHNEGPWNGVQQIIEYSVMDMFKQHGVVAFTVNMND